MRSPVQKVKTPETVTRRSLMLSAGCGVVCTGLAARMFHLQISKAEDFQSLSEDNRFNYNIILPQRGLIRDRHGEALSRNRQNYRALIVPERTRNIEMSLKAVDVVIPLSDKEQKRILKDVRDNPAFVPLLVRDNLDWPTFSALNMQIYTMPGIVPDVGSGRSYPNKGIFAHTLGYVGRAGQKDIESDRDPLLRQPTFRIGKTGVEAAAESTLRGKAGRLKVEVNAFGRIVREWPDPKDASISGEDVYLTLDAGLQRFAAEQFTTDDGEVDSGAVIVMDTMTGELRTLLSMPVFDPNDFVSGISQAQMDLLNNDPKRPQYNKALSGTYPPASTFKMVVMLAALESGLINPNEAVYCLGKLRLGNRTFHCWKRRGHGPMDMRDALKQSCDSYFYEISQIIGIDAVANMARRLGLGERHSLGVGGERSGIVPDGDWKQQRMGSGWRLGDTLNASIGQGFVLASPLHLAIMTARIANRQSAVRPHVMIGGDVPDFAPLDIDPEHLAFVQDAMWSVTSEVGGTAYAPNPYDLPGIEMAGKTGTGQVRGISASERASGVLKNRELEWKLRDHSLFVAYAPYDKPRFAIATVVEHGGSGSGRAATISRAVLGEALRRDGLAAL